MKHFTLIILLLYSLNSFSQVYYNGALERFKMKSDEAVREGLIGEYYAGHDFDKLVNIRQEQSIYFDWDFKSPIEELGSDNFSIRWRGKYYAKNGGKYILTIMTDDGMRVWLNGRLVLNAWKDQPPSTYEKRLILQEDAFYDIRIDYYQKNYQSTAAVFLHPFDEEQQPLNTSNTIFGKNLKSSTAEFDFWEEENLLSRFLMQVGLEEESQKEFLDKSYKVEQTDKTENKITENIKTAAVKNKKPSPQKVPENLYLVINEVSNASIDTLSNTYDSIHPGDVLIVDRLYFDRSKAYLREASFHELDQLFQALRRHPDWRIKIIGHTDNTGPRYPNLKLSYERSRAVYFYIIEKGISKTRLSYEGFGPDKPLVANDSEPAKQRNRRVEIELMGNESSISGL